MVRIPRLRRGFLRSSTGIVAFSTLLAVGVVVERVLTRTVPQSATAVDFYPNGKIELGRNVVSPPLASGVVRSGDLADSLPLPGLSSLSYQHRSILGLLSLGSLGFLASLRPFESKRPSARPTATQSEEQS